MCFWIWIPLKPYCNKHKIAFFSSLLQVLHTRIASNSSLLTCSYLIPAVLSLTGQNVGYQSFPIFTSLLVSSQYSIGLGLVPTFCLTSEFPSHYSYSSVPAVYWLLSSHGGLYFQLLRYFFFSQLRNQAESVVYEVQIRRVVNLAFIQEYQLSENVLLHTSRAQGKCIHWMAEHLCAFTSTSDMSYRADTWPTVCQWRHDLRVQAVQNAN